MPREAHVTIRDSDGEPLAELWAAHGHAYIEVPAGGAALNAAKREEFARAFTAASAAADRQAAQGTGPDTVRLAGEIEWMAGHAQ